LIQVNRQRLLDDLRALSRIGGRPDGGIDRLAWSDADLKGRQWFAKRLHDSGLEARTDEALNVLGRVPGSKGPWLLIGSHLDSVPQGGRLDGAYGAVASLEVLRTLLESGDESAQRVEVIGFADEEGVRFGAGLIGSLALAGELDVERLGNGRDWKGKPVVEVLSAAGVDLLRMPDAHRHLEQVSAFMELHIEQGPRMEAAGVDLAVVTGIVGVHRQQVRILGEQNHAGTTPFEMRKDAGRAAARVVAGLRELVQGIDTDAVGNVGVISFAPGGINVIPGRADFDLEIRHLKEPTVRAIVEAFQQSVDSICREEGCRAEVELRSYVPPAAMDPKIMDAFEMACKQSGRSYRQLASGAGHDAAVLSRHVPAGMLFIPSRGGVSHSPAEESSEEHLVLGAQALLDAVGRVSRSL
jgi:N-carbamoyl-L-amino-acid hydrolase